jgi:hypothetical protein
VQPAAVVPALPAPVAHEAGEKAQDAVPTWHWFSLSVFIAGLTQTAICWFWIWYFRCPCRRNHTPCRES